MFIHKRQFFSVLLKNKIYALNILIIILIFCVVLSRIEIVKNNERDDLTFSPISNVETDKNIYAVTVELSGNEEEKNIELISQILYGFDVEATFFVSADWLEANKELKEVIIENKHNFGLLIESLNENLDLLSQQNNKFYESCFYYPTYVRIKNSKLGKISELLDMFDQKYISSSYTISDIQSNVNRGDIINIYASGDEIPYQIVNCLNDCKKRGFKPVKLGDLLCEKYTN